MLNFENDKNPIRVFAVLVFIIPSAVVFYFSFRQNWSISTTFNLIGILCNFVGTLLVASGVYLFNTDKNYVQNGNPTKNKYVKKFAELFVSASRVIPLGVLFFFIGSAFQAIVLLGVELRWFHG